jgi:hypothetical protein
MAEKLHLLVAKPSILWTVFFFDNNDFMDGWGILIPTGFHRQQRGV